MADSPVRDCQKNVMGADLKWIQWSWDASVIFDCKSKSFISTPAGHFVLDELFSLLFQTLQRRAHSLAHSRCFSSSPPSGGHGVRSLVLLGLCEATEALI